MRLLALVESTNHVCYRYRVAAFRQALAANGWTVEAAPIAESNRERLLQLRRLPDCDVMLVQRRLLPLWYCYALRQQTQRLIFDFDDAVFLRDSNSRKSPNSLRRVNRFARIAKMCDGVIAGNRYLADKAAKIISASRVYMVPTCIDTSQYEVAGHFRRGTATRLVWIGSSSTLASLEEARPHITQATATAGGVRMHAICDTFPNWPEVRVERRTWSAETESAELAAGDIGVSWLPDHPWSLGKCGLKVLQYMASGLPVVANPIGMHPQLVQHERTGMLAASPEDWTVAIRRLANDPALRQDMGTRAREVVERDYSVSRWSSKFVDILNQMLETSPSQPLSRAA